MRGRIRRVECAAAQRAFKEYPGREYTDFPGAAASGTARSLNGPVRVSALPGIYRGFRGGDSNWTTDYPRSDRHLLQGIRRLEPYRHALGEQVVDLDGTDDVYNWPAMYAVEVGLGRSSDQQAAQLREFLLRGGFLMVDDFHSTLMADLSRRDQESLSGPRDRRHRQQRSDLPYHLRFRTIVSRCPARSTYGAGAPTSRTGIGRPDHWRAIYDDKGRIGGDLPQHQDLVRRLGILGFHDDPRS